MDAPAKKGNKVLFYLGLFALVTSAVIVGNKITEQWNKPKVAPPATTPSTSSAPS